MVGCAERLGLNYTKLVINIVSLTLPAWEFARLNYTKLVINWKVACSLTKASNCLNYTKLVINLIL